jgi:hypothetical protein
MRKILFKTTIPPTADDWHVGRFSLLASHLASLGFSVTARDRAPGASGDDRDLAALPESDFAQLWLFAVDVGGGLSAADAQAILRFVARGGGLLFTRDHHDVGACLLHLGELGEAHFFHSTNREPEGWRHCADNLVHPGIRFPNYDSGRNGDLQTIEPQTPLHPLLRRAANGEAITRFPAHPHEGAVGVPASARARARLIAKGRSRTSGRDFNLIVAFEPDPAAEGAGRAVAHSSFHHFADYNWDPRLGCPSFVTDPEGNQVHADPRALDDIRAHCANLARWLSAQQIPARRPSARRHKAGFSSVW